MTFQSQPSNPGSKFRYPPKKGFAYASRQLSICQLDKFTSTYEKFLFSISVEQNKLSIDYDFLGYDKRKGKERKGTLFKCLVDLALEH